MSQTTKCGLCGNPIHNSLGFCQRTPRCRNAYSSAYNIACRNAAKRRQCSRAQQTMPPPAPPQPAPSPVRREIGPGLHTTRNPESIRPAAVLHGCSIAMRECLLDLKMFADRGLAILDVLDKRLENSKKDIVPPLGVETKKLDVAPPNAEGGGG